jgi:biopolymer transport protein ExbD
MKVRGAGSRKDDKIDLNMTPMIDIVFQLLTFFIMSLKIAALEGDFSIKMPLQGKQARSPDSRELAPFRLRMTANADGSLKSLRLDQQMIEANITKPEQARQAFEKLHLHVIERVGVDSGPGSVRDTAEVEIDCDYELDYVNIVDAITAVSGYVSPHDGKSIVKLIDKIKFAPPRPPAE